MGNIVNARIKIVGTRPLFFHKFGPDAMPLKKQERTGVAGNDPEEWRKTVSVTKSGQLFVDPSYVFATMRDGARYTKNGRGSIQSQVAATLQIVDDRVLIDRFWPGFPNGHDFDVLKVDPPKDDSEEPVYMDVRGVRNPTTKARNVRYRICCAKGWGCGFSIMWDKTIVNRTQMEAVLIDAGKLCGIGNARAIGMGRFDIVSFEIK
jgi:hypothetical protein